MAPTEIQRRIIEQEGNLVVMASPGSGKTYVISEKMKAILRKEDFYDYQGVIAISYTRKASSHLKERTLEGGLSSKNSFFGTIDSFCLTQVILAFGNYVIGYPEKEVTPVDEKDLPADKKDNFAWITKIHPDYNDVDKDKWKNLFDFFKEGYVLIQSLELMALYVFRCSQACRNYLKARFRYVFIDEYQDADTYTDELLRELVALGLKGVVVGDKNQSIFGFAHKDSKYLQHLSENEDFVTYELSNNFRCAPSIINYSNRLLNARCELIDTDTKGMNYVLVEGGEESVADFLSQYIPSLCSRKKVASLNKVAILVKNSRTQHLIDVALTIPHRLVETTVLDQELNPLSRLYAELLQFYFDPAKKLMSIIDEYIDYDSLRISDMKELVSLKNTIRAIKENDDIIKMLPSLFKKVGKIMLPNQNEGLSEEKLKEVLADEKMIATYKPVSDNEVALMTLHKSKGLEFDYVFHLNLNEWELPAKAPKDGDFNNPSFLSYEQDLDLHYVGITRARIGCCLVGSTIRTTSRGTTTKATASEFLQINGLRELRSDFSYSDGQFKRQ